ncbi:MAG: MoaD/ThiS family protein, partial [Pyrinomonadaceae bacterium]
TADLVGKRELDVSHHEGVKVSHVVSDLVGQFPGLRDHRLLYSVNLSYVVDDTVLHDGDEIAVFTAVSGG